MKSATRRQNEFLSGVSRAILVILTMALGVYAYVVLAQGVIGSTMLGGWPGALIFVAVLIVGWMPAVVVHELGHALAAQALGWRVWMFSIGPWIWRLHPRVKVEFGSPLAIDAGGFVLPAPKTAAANTRWRDVFVSAGGPAISVIAAIATYLAALPFDTGRDDDKFVASLLIAFSASSWVSALITLWPFPDEGWSNDIQHIFHKLLAKPQHRPTALVYGHSLKKYGFQTVDFDPWIRDPVAAAERRQTTLTGQYLAALEAERFAEARALLGHESDDERNLMHAYLDIVVDGDLDAAEKRMIKSPPADWDAGARLRELTLVSILTAAGETASAEMRLVGLEKTIGFDTPPQPVWRLLIDRARALLPEHTGPWRRARQST